MDDKEKSQNEDTEGQAKRLAEDEDDTEGHRGRRISAEGAEDDTEGHRRA